MPSRRISLPAVLRGSAAGIATATLTAAAHAAAGGGLPSGAGTVHLGLLGLTIGVLTAALRRGGDYAVLVPALLAGQVAGHELLGAAGHHHGASATAPAGLMLAAHAAAVAVIAALIVVGEILCRTVSRALRVARRSPSSPFPGPAVPVVRWCAHPMRSTLLVAASSSYRGPPVSAFR